MVMSLLESGDEIMVIVPNYMQIAGWAEAIGVNVIEVPLDPARDWLPDLIKLESLLTSKTKMITICHPNNPTGSTLPLVEINKLANFAKKHDLYLHADEVYRGADFDGHELPSFADVYDKAIITCGLSKAMAMPGLRIGWLVGLSEDIYKSWQRKDYTSITTAAVSEYVATIVLEPTFRSKVLNRSKDYLKNNLALLENWVEKNKNWVSFIPPKAGGMAFLKYELAINSTELAHIFRKELGVLILPGDVYGLDGYFRVGIGAPTDHLDQGLERISAYVNRHYAK
jgi:aspartate/methionine/tyrosine aminotransferase